ncbi:MAG: TonB-dependent receptor plug domain-containing protein [Candidatus Cryptobacteroides sp.]
MNFNLLIQIPLALFLDLSEVPDFSEAPSDTLQSAILLRDRSNSGFRQDTLYLEKAQGISEIILQNPSLSLTDYGGLASQKNISFPGLGSSHTSIYVDGFKVKNNQSGQIDLSLLCLDNYSDLVLDYTRSSVYLHSSSPKLDQKFALTASLAAASFYTWAPDLRVDYKLGNHTAMALYLGVLKSEGDFPYGEARRTNNDLSRYAAQLDFRGKALKGDWTAKLSLNSQDRGVPGSLTYSSSDRQMDNNYFVQGSYRRSLSSQYDFSIGLKASLDELSYLSEYGDNEYRESNFQFVWDHSYHPLDWLEFSLLLNADYADLYSDLYEAGRLDVEALSGVQFSWKSFTVEASLKYEYVKDLNRADSQLSSGVFSPALGFTYSPFKFFDLKAYSKRAYRNPTFNELYYPNYSNPSLSPEDAFLSGLSLDCHTEAGECWHFALSLGGFYNYLKDKIVSLPVEEGSYIWLPYNIGEAKCYGSEVKFDSRFEREDLKAYTSWRYSYQYSDDLPYFVSHSLSLKAGAQWKSWDASALWCLRSGRHSPYGELPDWNTLDVHLSKDLGRHFKLRLSCLNLFDYRYELVEDYPMQGRSFRICLLYSM